MRALLLLCLVAMVARGQSAWPPKQDAYDLATAFRSVMYSASAYSTNPTECIPDSWQFNSTATFSASDGDGDTLFAFAGVNHEMKEVVMSFRGTSKPAQLVVEFFSSLAIKPVFDGDNTYLAFDYWVDAVTKLQTQSMPYVSRLLTAHPDYKLLVTGHSLGAAMASVWTSRFFNFGYAPPTTTVWEYSFGQPRVGNYDYATLHDSLPITSYRLSHYRDPIVHLPFCHGLLSCSAKSGTTWAYHHGVEVFYNAHDMPASSSGQVCLGTPHNEDEKCSAGYLGDSVDDHLYYFDLHVGVYCPDTASNFVPSLRSNSYSSSYGEGLTMNMQYRPSNPPLHEIVNMQQAESALEAARAARRDE